MAGIGDLYNAANVVVGQAACFIAPSFTPLPDISLTALATGTPDAFDFSPWDFTTLKAVTAAITGGTFTLTYTFNGVAYTTSALTATTATASQVDAAVTLALAPLAPSASEVLVSGGPVSALATPFLISLSERLSGGVWSVTPTSIVGGTLALVPALWRPLGATDQGWTWGSNKSTSDIYIEEQTTQVAKTMQSQAITVQGALAEDTMATLALAFNMTSGITAASSGHAGFTTNTLTDGVLSYAVALVMANFNQFPRWLYIPQATSLDNVTAAFRRANAKRMYGVTFTSICQTNTIVLEDVFQRGS